MSSTISDLLTNPTYGLLAYIASNVDPDYTSEGIMPYEFGTVGDTSGFRLRGDPSSFQNETHQVSREIALGRKIKIMPGTTDQVKLAELSELLSHTIHEWSRCKAPGLLSEIQNLSSAPFRRLDKGTNQWWGVVVKEFEITYYV